jgi:hypothetical protein
LALRQPALALQPRSELQTISPQHRRHGEREREAILDGEREAIPETTTNQKKRFRELREARCQSACTPIVSRYS